MNPYYITTPIYYVNDVPHIGHAYTSIACDVKARFKRLQGTDVYFLTGTDEHGQKVEKSAEKAGLPTQAFVDKYAEPFRSLAALLKLSNDDFIRTTEPRHIKASQAIWEKLVDAGEIYLGSYAGWYSVRDEAFYAESELVDGKAPTGAPVEWVEEPSYFFKLSKWQQPLLDFYKAHPDFIQPESRRNEVVRFVEGGLTDLSVSRTSFSWGIPVPGDEKHVMYVWLDALTNYATAVGYPDEQSETFRKWWPHVTHVVGKDIIRFHAVYWPAFLMAAGLTPPQQVFAHGWWTNEGQKISKSLGNVIDPVQLVEQYGLDPVRYFLLTEVPFGNDGNFSRQSLVNRVNAELANNVGNLAQRTLVQIQRNCDGKVPEPGSFTAEDRELLALAENLYQRYGEALEHFRFHEAAALIIHQLGNAANGYIDAQAPWALKKTDPERMKTVLYVLAEAIRHIAIYLLPYVDTAANGMLDLLAVDKNARHYGYLGEKGRIAPGTALPEPRIIFPKLEGEGNAAG